MKMFKLLTLSLLISIVTVSCMKEEPEIETCSCVTRVTEINGNVISVVNSAEESPITGNCLDLNSTFVDNEKGILTTKLCR